MKSIAIFGHKNPDTDSIAAAMGLAHLKEKLGIQATPYRLGPISEETKFALSYFHLDSPKRLRNVKTTLNDVPFKKVPSVHYEISLLEAIQNMEENNLSALAVTSKNRHLIGMVELESMALNLLQKPTSHIAAPLANIVKGLKGALLTKSNSHYVNGEMVIPAHYYPTLVKTKALKDNHIAIIGNQYDIIELAIDARLPLIIIASSDPLPKKLLSQADKKEVTIISTPYSMYDITRSLPLCQPIASYIKKDPVTFYVTDYLENVMEDVKNNPDKRFFPILDSEDHYLGLLSRRTLMKVEGKPVILVDHNEYAQSVEGLKEAHILEIYDHHKLGDIRTDYPVQFKNIPVGSSSTIVFGEFLEKDLMPEPAYAGILLSGILSDTLDLTSPTATPYDHEAVEVLEKYLSLDAETFSKALFKAGTALKDLSAKELFLRDCKWFEEDGKQLVISQIFTFEMETIETHLDDLLSYMNALRKEKRNTYVFLLVTDLLKKGSFLYFSPDEKALARAAFGESIEIGSFLPEVVSRKKQIMPLLMSMIRDV